MTVTDQIKFIDNKIKGNQAQYDLDRLTAKISVLSSGELKKYEYLTGEDLGYRPSVLKQTRFYYCPLGKFFIKGLDEDDKKEGLFKRLKNIEGKNEKLLKEIKDQKTKQPAEKDRETNKTKNPLIYDSKHSFYKYRLSEFNKISSIDSKFDIIEKCYKDFISLMDVDAEPENIEHKLVVLNKVSKLFDDLIKEYKQVYERESKNDKSDSWKLKCDPRNLKTLDYQSVKLERKSLPDEDRSDVKQPTQLKQLNLNEVSKPLWINLSREDFNSLAKDVADNRQ